MTDPGLPTETTVPSGYPRREIAAIWLTAEPVRTPIEHLLLDMLAPSLPSLVLREAEIEEMGRGAKLAAVALDYLGLRRVGVDEAGPTPLRIVVPKSPRDPWREALVLPGGDRPIGLLIYTADAGPLVLVHEVFGRFGEAQRDLVRRYADLAVRGRSHADIIAELGAAPEFPGLLALACRNVQSLDPAVLFSPDGTTRVQLGSLPQTTRDILREGLEGRQVFILPASLYEGKTNYGDVEFLVYLNFFLRQQARTLIVGTERQRGVLHRLLTLTLFGLFDPSTPEPVPFETARDVWGVESHEVYAFLLAAHQTYAVRAGVEPDSPLLGIDDYVEFVPLVGDETAIALPGAEVRVVQRGRAFSVRIAQPDGLEAEKLLEVGPARRVSRAISEEQRAALRFASDRPRFAVTPLGTSHGFDHAGDFTSFIVWINGKGILVDPSPEALGYLEQIGVASVDVPYVLLTHVHSDHDGGLLEKLLSGSRTTVIASDPVFRSFVEKARLVTGHDFVKQELVAHIPANPGQRVRLEVGGERVEIETRWNLHPIPTNGFKLSFEGRVFGYSGDTQYDPAFLDALSARGKMSPEIRDNLLHFFWTPAGEPTVDLLYHEAGIPPIHTDKAVLRELPAAVRERTRLVHIADQDVPEGFMPAKPPLFGTEVLVPATPRSRERALLETLRLVAYLYDMPDDTLEALLRRGRVVAHAPDAVILHKGPVGRSEPLHFYVVTDGRVSVRDGRRIIAKLLKADTFGEWGISHQRGFRVADVMADGPSQTIRFDEDTYRWLVDRHPVLQERVSRIRTLLPRLQLAQGRARLKAEVGMRSVVEAMTASQLSSLAIFSTVQIYKQGQPVLLRGAPADGFYVLLSGHLVVGVDGRMVGELAEGDVFGELGLLEEGTREADVTVASADAEVLFVSSRSFRELLETVPAFAWGIWETVAGRRSERRRRLTDSSAPGARS